jgi:hypothetical protein
MTISDHVENLLRTAEEETSALELATRASTADAVEMITAAMELNACAERLLSWGRWNLNMKRGQHGKHEN